MVIPCLLRCPHGPKSHGGAQGRNKKTRNKTKRSAHVPYGHMYPDHLLSSSRAHRKDAEGGWRASPFTGLNYPPTHAAQHWASVQNICNLKLQNQLLSACLHLYKSQTSWWLYLLGNSVPFGFTTFFCLLTFSPAQHTSEEMRDSPFTLSLNTSIYQDMRQNSKKYSLLFVQTSVPTLHSLQTCISLFFLFIKLMAHNPPIPMCFQGISGKAAVQQIEW